jgi:hypothetical protein
MNGLLAPSPLTGGEAGNLQSAALHQRSGSAMQGRAFGWGGGELVMHRIATSTLLHPLTPTLALPRQGGGNKRGNGNG